MKNQNFITVLLVAILLASCAPAPAFSPTTISTLTPTLLPTETFTPEPTATREPTQAPTEVPLNPDWLAAINKVSGKENQFPKTPYETFYCVVDYANARLVNYMYGDLQVLSEVDCYYNDINQKKQHITWLAVGYNATQDALYQMGRSITKGRGKPGDAYVSHSVANFCGRAVEEGRPCTIMFNFVEPSELTGWGDLASILAGALSKFGTPPADFLATGDPSSIPLTGGSRLVITPALMTITSAN